MVPAGEAGLAEATREHRLDGDAIAGVDAPALGGAVADLLDDAEGFVARDHRRRRPQRALELLVVAAADPAGFDAKKRVVVTNFWDG